MAVNHWSDGGQRARLGLSESLPQQIGVPSSGKPHVYPYAPSIDAKWASGGASQPPNGPGRGSGPQQPTDLSSRSPHVCPPAAGGGEDFTIRRDCLAEANLAHVLGLVVEAGPQHAAAPS